jgi:hypothetical protein
MRDLIKFASNMMIIRCRRAVNPGDALSPRLSLRGAKTALQSQQEPNRSTREVVETVGFVSKIDDGREADFRLANRRLRPLGYLTLRLAALAQGEPRVWKYTLRKYLTICEFSGEGEFRRRVSRKPSPSA